MKAATSETGEPGGMAGSRTVRVWDPLVRVFHWSLAASFLGAYLIGEDGGQLHRALGYTVLGLIAFRLLWGVIGTRHARFASFIPSPRTLRNYVGDVATHREKRYLGHNPAGAAMIVALLLAVTATGVTGWMMTTDAFWGAEEIEDVHEVFANGTLLLVALHVGGVIFSSLRHRENLVRAMITGRKRAE
jgi:cytochrome b